MTGRPTAAADQVQVSVADVTAALEPREWQFAVAEERPRDVSGSGVDAVVLAKRLGSQPAIVPEGQVLRR